MLHKCTIFAIIYTLFILKNNTHWIFECRFHQTNSVCKNTDLEKLFGLSAELRVFGVGNR